MARDIVAMGALMDGVETQELIVSSGQVGRPFGRPCHGGPVVAFKPLGLLRDVMLLLKGVLVLGDHTGQFQQVEKRIVGRDEGLYNMLRDPLAPNNRRCIGHQGVKPNTCTIR